MGGSAYVEGVEIPEFDNFNTDYSFEWKGKTWQCAEALYQALKFKNKSYREEIRLATPEVVWGMGQNRQYETVDGFFEKRHRIMYLVNYMTHLYDALGKLLQEWIPEQRAQHHLFVITDGLDNGSRKVTQNQAKHACKVAVQDYGWQITHCDIYANKLNFPGIKQVVYDVDNLDQLLSNLRI